jgi:hypothetical protein
MRYRARLLPARHDLALEGGRPPAHADAGRHGYIYTYYRCNFGIVGRSSKVTNKFWFAIDVTQSVEMIVIDCRIFELVH